MTGNCQLIFIIILLAACDSTGFKSTGGSVNYRSQDKPEAATDDSGPSSSTETSVDGSATSDDTPILSCKVVLSSTEITQGGSLTATLEVLGDVGESFLDGDSVKLGVKITKTPTASGSISAVVKSKDKATEATCAASVTVNIPIAPTCKFELTVPRNAQNGPEIRIESVISGKVIGAGDFTRIDFDQQVFNYDVLLNNREFSFAKIPTVGANTSDFLVTYEATITGPTGTNTCVSEPVRVVIPPLPQCTVNASKTLVGIGETIAVNMLPVGSTPIKRAVAIFSGANLDVTLPYTRPNIAIMNDQDFYGQVYGYGRSQPYQCKTTVKVVPPVSQPPTCNLVLSANPLIAGGSASATITLASGQATSYTIDGVAAQVGVPFPLTNTAASRDVLGVVSGPVGPSSCNQYLMVNQPLAPQCSVTVNQTSINLTANVTGAFTITGNFTESTILFQNLSIVGDTTVTKVANGSYTFIRTPTLGSFTTDFVRNFKVDVSGPGGRTSCQKSVTVIVPPEPSCSLSASQNPADLNTSVDVTMQIFGTSSAIEFDNGTGFKAVTTSPYIESKMMTSAITFNGRVKGIGRTTFINCPPLLVEIKIPDPKPDYLGCALLSDQKQGYPSSCQDNRVVAVINNGQSEELSCCPIASGVLSTDPIKKHVVRTSCLTNEVLTGLEDSFAGNFTALTRLRCTEVNTTYFAVEMQPGVARLFTSPADDAVLGPLGIRDLIYSYKIHNACSCVQSGAIMMGPHSWFDAPCTEQCAIIKKK